MNDRLTSPSGFVLLDVDEVLLAWFPGFLPFSEERLSRRLKKEGPGQFDMTSWLGFSDRSDTLALVREFNESEGTGSGDLAPVPGAVEGVRALKRLGYRLVAITNFSDLPAPARRRHENIERVFGPGVIEDLICLPLGACKAEALSRFPSAAWIDDLPKNVLAGHAAGHSSAVMHAHHNVAQRQAFTSAHGLPWLMDWRDVVRALDCQPAPSQEVGFSNVR